MRKLLSTALTVNFILVLTLILMITLKKEEVPNKDHIYTPLHKSDSATQFHTTPSSDGSKIDFSSPAKILFTDDAVTNLKNNYTQLVVIKEDDNYFCIYSKLPNDKILMTKFTQKHWGTWNIHSWNIVNDNNIPAKKYYRVVGGGSDWEYVFRVAKNVNDRYVFSGGNHENEILKSLRFFDNDKNLELPLTTGEIYYLSNLKIVEETYLTINNSPSEKYAHVIRTYYISPSKINLHTTFNFIKDIYMGMSYVCMLPVNKSYGQHIKFLDSGNIYSTPKSGNTLSTPEFNNFIGKEKTMSVKIWGDLEPSYNFIVGIETEEMIDYFKNDHKVFFWDLNTNGNKLYFSKYNNEDYHLVKEGTTWHKSSYWSLVLD
ncbi:UNVERIFIED_CONTAM: hypothetical protein Cloal_3900 [Acetivibrio alkalicellulosi]